MSERTLKLEAVLEAFIDKSNLLTVIRDLEAVCYAKAEHLRENWRDEQTAKVWEQAAAKLEQAESFAVDAGI